LTFTKTLFFITSSLSTRPIFQPHFICKLFIITRLISTCSIVEWIFISIECFLSMSLSIVASRLLFVIFLKRCLKGLLKLCWSLHFILLKLLVWSLSREFAVSMRITMMLIIIVRLFVMLMVLMT